MQAEAPQGHDPLSWRDAAQQQPQPTVETHPPARRLGPRQPPLDGRQAPQGTRQRAIESPTGDEGIEETERSAERGSSGEIDLLQQSLDLVQDSRARDRPQGIGCKGRRELASRRPREAAAQPGGVPCPSEHPGRVIQKARLVERSNPPLAKIFETSHGIDEPVAGGSREWQSQRIDAEVAAQQVFLDARGRDVRQRAGPGVALATRTGQVDPNLVPFDGCSEEPRADDRATPELLRAGGNLIEPVGEKYVEIDDRQIQEQISDRPTHEKNANPELICFANQCAQRTAAQPKLLPEPPPELGSAQAAHLPASPRG